MFGIAWVWLAVVTSDRMVSLLELAVRSSPLQDNNVTCPNDTRIIFSFWLDFRRGPIFIFARIFAHVS